ncbi:MAG: Y-family DNA polymerase, partial [Thiobacillaceae bacterium]
MLWLALYFPAFPLEIFSRGRAAPYPLTVTEKQGSRTRVATCNAAAAAYGVRPGMPASAAQALATGLVMRVRDPDAEQESLAGLATWAGRFTPAVSLQTPNGLLLEIGSCLRLHHGLNKLLGQVLAGVKAMGYAANHACAPTPQSAWLLARAGTQAVVREVGQLESFLGVLSVGLLDQPAETLEGLEKIGVHTLGDCLRLPRAGTTRRFGGELLDELDRALGRVPEARAFFVPPHRFMRRLALPVPVEEAEALLFATRRLLPELETYLVLRQAGVQELELVCRHEDTSDTVLKLGFVQPVRSADQMLLLMRETLVCRRLPAPVHAIVLHAHRILPLPALSADLFQAQVQGREGNLLLERLRIRLGKEAVFGIATVPDSRPERAWQSCTAGNEVASSGKLQRPLWLLKKPLPYRN